MLSIILANSQFLTTIVSGDDCLQTLFSNGQDIQSLFGTRIFCVNSEDDMRNVFFDYVKLFIYYIVPLL